MGQSLVGEETLVENGLGGAEHQLRGGAYVVDVDLGKVGRGEVEAGRVLVEWLKMDGYTD